MPEKEDLSYGEKSCLIGHIKDWLELQTPDMIYIMRQVYAEELKCPLCEVTEEFESNEDLFWVYSKYQDDIDEMTVIH